MASEESGIKKKRKKYEGSFMIWGVPDRVKSKFKSACAKRKTSMRDVIIEFMRAYGSH